MTTSTSASTNTARLRQPSGETKLPDTGGADTGGATPAPGRSRIRIVNSPAYEREAARTLLGFDTSVPVCKVPVPADVDAKQWLEQAASRIKEKTKIDREWNMRLSEKDGKQCIEIRHSRRVAYALRDEILGAGKPGNVARDASQVDVEFAAIANPICKEFENLWMEQTRNLPPWRADLSGMTIVNLKASKEQYSDYVRGLLNGDSFCIGEKHSHLTPGAFLIENMALFKQHGFTTLYLEGLTKETQDDLDGYIGGPPDAMLPEPLKLAWFQDMKLEVLKQAKTAGMRVVGVDSDFAGTSTLDNEDQSAFVRSRGAALNYAAVKAIEDDAPHRREGKFIVYVGAAHVNLADEAGAITGIPEVLGIKSVIISDINQENMGSFQPKRPFALICSEGAIHLDPSAPWLRQATNVKADIHMCAWFLADMEVSEEPSPLLQQRPETFQPFAAEPESKLEDKRPGQS